MFCSFFLVCCMVFTCCGNHDCKPAPPQHHECGHFSTPPACHGEDPCGSQAGSPE